MSRKMVNEVFFSATLSGPTKLFYVWLAFRGNKNGWVRWPVSKIMDELGVSGRAIRLWLSALTAADVIKYHMPKPGVLHVDLLNIGPTAVKKLQPRRQATTNVSWIDDVLKVDHEVAENCQPSAESCQPLARTCQNNKVEKEHIKETSKTTAPLGAVARKTSDQVLSGAKMRQAQTQMEAAKKRAVICPTPMDAAKEAAAPPPVATWPLSKWASTLSTAFRDHGVTLQGYNSARVIRPQIQVILTALASQGWPIEKVYDFLVVWLPKNCQRVGVELFRKDANWLVSLGLITSRLPEVTEMYEASGKRKHRLKDEGVMTF